MKVEKKSITIAIGDAWLKKEDTVLKKLKEANDMDSKDRMEAIHKRQSEIIRSNKKALKSRYLEYLKSEDWDRKRRLVLKRANHNCEGCGSESIGLEVHHLNYDRKGNELLTDLVAYCGACHDLAHGYASTELDIEWQLYLCLASDFRPKPISEMSEVEKEEYFRKILDM